MKCLKTMSSLLLSAALLAGCSSGGNEAKSDSKDQKDYTVGVAQLVDHTSLNTIRDAMFDEFEELGYKDGENFTIDYQNAAGQQNTLDTIMSNYASQNVDAIVAIATPTAQAAQNYSSNIPVVFSAVSDPKGAGLVESIEEPGGNITGTSDEVQVDQIVDLILEIVPDTKTVGVLYNAAEANSQTNIKNFEKYAESKGLKVKEATGTDLTTMQQAATSLAEDVDVMFSPNDNTVASGMTTLSQIALDAGVPFFTGADSMVQDGGFATVGIDYEELGRETAKMVVDVLNDTSPSEIPVKIFKDDLNIYVNENALKKLNITLPEDIANNEKLIMITSQDAKD